MGPIDHATAKRIHSKTREFETRCCRNLSIFACLCATISIILNAYNFVDTTSNDCYLSSKAKSVMRNLLDAEIEQKIEAYFSATSSLRIRREALLDKPSAVEDNNVTPHVEFFNPKMRGELEEKDDVEQRRTGAKGPAPGGDTWVWLTSYSRVPYKVVQGFCKATQDYCPPGVQGPKGSSGAPGPKGDRGDPGTSGIPGSPGAKGPVGPPGPRGERGFPGNPGLDGRDGVPGEPGLDGMSGRNGADGAPGKDGKDGMPGRDGMPGKNGKDGKDGKQGPQGPQGPKGLKGDRGPQGLKGARGTDGQDGMPGKPGISAYNYAKEKELLIPPTFARDSEKVIIDENEFLRLPCTAAGKPEPTLEWRRTDSAAIYNGAWRDGSIPGRWLNVTNISRHHSGKYVCLANNGIQPPVNKTFDIQVRFSPFIRVRDNEVFAYNRTAVLECEVQAWPEPVMNWNTDNTPIDDNHPRYRPERVATDLPWRWIMKLHIPFVKDTDLKEYRCVAKNDNLKNNMTTEGIIKVKIPDPNQKPIRRMGQFEWGSIPPKFTSLEELCQIQDCPVCTQCERSKLTITPLRDSSLNFRKPRQTRCQLYAIGKPVFHKSVDEQFGTWLRDSWPSNPEQENRLWSTDENENSILKEFNDKVTFKKNKPDRTYRLPRPFFGNGHIMYNGSFFYQEASSTRPGKIIKYDLMNSRLEDELLPYAGGRLYSSGHNQVDFNADDNGLWVVYSLIDSNNTAVAKLNLDDAGRIRFDHIWNISLHHGQFGEMFIVCGVLYGLESNTERDTRVSIAIDLFLNKPLEIPTLSFTNPFKKTTLLGYDHRHKELYSWDRGNHLTYPVRYNELPGP